MCHLRHLRAIKAVFDFAIGKLLITNFLIFRQLTFRSDKGCRTYRKVRFAFCHYTKCHFRLAIQIASEHLLHRLWCHCADFL
ncbi:Uncharacterised protein [Vibrio cholerae]|nr:Uncharacterised protein [Vibrio cholerae]